MHDFVLCIRDRKPLFSVIFFHAEAVAVPLYDIVHYDVLWYRFCYI